MLRVVFEPTPQFALGANFFGERERERERVDATSGTNGNEREDREKKNVSPCGFPWCVAHRIQSAFRFGVG